MKNLLFNPNMTAAEKIEIRNNRRTTESNFETFHTIYTETRDKTPIDTITAFVAAVGYTAAVVTIAELVNTVDEHDPRVSEKNHEWTAGIEDAATNLELGKAGLYPAWIHPVHIDQIADAMRCEYVPETPETTTDDGQPEKAATEAGPDDMTKRANVENRTIDELKHIATAADLTRHDLTPYDYYILRSVWENNLRSGRPAALAAHFPNVAAFFHNCGYSVEFNARKEIYTITL